MFSLVFASIRLGESTHVKNQNTTGLNWSASHVAFAPVNEVKKKKRKEKSPIINMGSPNRVLVVGKTFQVIEQPLEDA